MAEIPSEIKAAIEAAVKEFGQGSALAKELVAWYSEVAKGNEDFQYSKVESRVELLLAQVAPPPQVD